MAENNKFSIGAELTKAAEKYQGSTALMGKTMLTEFNYNNGSRNIMFTSHLGQFVNLVNPEHPGVRTTGENVVGKYSSGYLKLKHDTVLYKRVDKYSDIVDTPLVSKVFLYDKEKKKYTVKTIQQCENLTEHYGYEYDNGEIDSYNEGETIPAGTVIYKSRSYDEFMNYGYGVNIPILYTTDPRTHEDGCIVSETAAKELLKSTEVETITVGVNMNDILLNIYGTNKKYKVFPNVGEYIEDGILCCKRTLIGDQTLYDFKNDSLSNPNTLDQHYYSKGKVIDIDVYCNNQELECTPFNKQICKYLEHETAYYQEIYDTCESIINSGKDYSRDVDYLYKQAIDFLDTDKKWKEKDSSFNNIQLRITVMREVEGKTLYDITIENKTADSLTEAITESVIDELSENDRLGTPNLKKNITEEVKQYMKNITISNEPIPLPILEEGVESYAEYYREFVEKTVTEAGEPGISFNKVMQSIDTGMHNSKNFKTSVTTKGESFKKVHDCYIKLIDSIHILPIEIMNEVIGYYYIQEEDITPLSGMLTSTVYYGKYDSNENENNILSQIAEAIVMAFDKKFLEKNIKFKKLIVEALNYYKLHNRKIKFQYIPKEYMQAFIVNEDEMGHGRSMIEKSLFYAKLYLMILLFKIMSIILYSNDTKVNYIKQSGIEKNIANKIQEIARIKQQRQVSLTDMFSYTTLINKIGQGSEMYVPVGRSGERGIETEILQGQDVQINNEFMEMLKKAYITGTGVPDVLINYLHEAEFAKTLELANTRFQSLVVSYQMDYNNQITDWYKMILKNCTNIPENIINNLKFSFAHPKYSTSTITNELLSNHTALQDFLVQLYFGQNADDDENAQKVMKFKKELAILRLPMLNFKEIDDIFKESNIEGTLQNLKKSSSNETSDDSGDSGESSGNNEDTGGSEGEDTDYDAES